MADQDPKQPSSPESPVEKSFSWNRKGRRPAPLKLGGQEEGNGESWAGPSQGVTLPGKTKFFLPPSSEFENGDEIDELFNAPEDFFTCEQQDRVQRWVDDQPSCYAIPNILTPRSPRPPPLGTQFVGLGHQSTWSRSRSGHSHSELDLESCGSGDGVWDVVEAYRDNPYYMVPTGCNPAFCDRCGTHLGAAAGSAGRGWSAGKVVIYAAGTVVLYGAGAVGMFWAKAVWDYLTEYHS